MISLQNHIFNEHCRFKLKSGKEIFGIIWEIRVNETPVYYFTSASHKAKIDASLNRLEMIRSVGIELDINDVVLAENLAS